METKRHDFWRKALRLLTTLSRWSLWLLATLGTPAVAIWLAHQPAVADTVLYVEELFGIPGALASAQLWLWVLLGITTVCLGAYLPPMRWKLLARTRFRHLEPDLVPSAYKILRRRADICEAARLTYVEKVPVRRTVTDPDTGRNRELTEYREKLLLPRFLRFASDDEMNLFFDLEVLARHGFTTEDAVKAQDRIEASITALIKRDARVEVRRTSPVIARVSVILHEPLESVERFDEFAWDSVE